MSLFLSLKVLFLFQSTIGVFNTVHRTLDNYCAVSPAFDSPNLLLCVQTWSLPIPQAISIPSFFASVGESGDFWEHSCHFSIYLASFHYCSKTTISSSAQTSLISSHLLAKSHHWITYRKNQQMLWALLHAFHSSFPNSLPIYCQLKFAWEPRLV